MQITANSLYRDSRNFFQHQLITLILIALLAAAADSILIHCLINNNTEQLIISERNNIQDYSSFKMINNISSEQKYKLLRNFILVNFCELVGNTFLLGGVLYLIPAVSKKKQVSLSGAMNELISFLPNLIVLILLINIITQIGFMMLIFPGILLTALLSMSPIILVNDKIGIFESINNSINIVLKNINIIAPVITLCLLSKIICIIFFSFMSMFSENLMLFLFIVVKNLIITFMIVYLYRFYILLNKQF
ncbi:hypothetical protein CRV12_00830 [Candidatus Pantoea edessiphila]|uniref:UPF0259 membrane protein CRV12_00830 n=1 Tax=Candidatus Pantoea edessiphila TaxID=2044610 RepID=A0A2P5T0Q1_9GAMM|nr:YciC family protein [Candidatus Pantoea edessiphila]PPI88168.1 hypothetical protein CRV12_00830 [Candidatus Pantoea edessiphila]